MSKLGDYMDWVYVMLKTPIEERRKWVTEIMNGFRALGPKKRDKSVRYLSDVLSEQKEFHLIGFVPKMEYIKVEGPDEQLGVIFEHQHMNPALVYKHNELPVFIIAGPKLNWDKHQGISG